ncbi:MAG: hypothetical protein N3A63_08340 [Bacteroidetes bacterium]|nr:hypothetical protein [Bacteroidota bacterium]
MVQSVAKTFSLLILSCSGGAGHNRAAEGLYRTAQQLKIPIHIEQYDVLDFTSPLFKRLYSETYIHLVNTAPELWGYMYERTEKRPYRKQWIVQLFDHFNYKRYQRFLSKRKPDAIVCTHFLPFLALQHNLGTNVQYRFFAATTDFDVHQLWIHPVVEHYYVFCEETAWQLAAKGVKRETISVTGIPLVPEFTKVRSKQDARKNLALPLTNFTILLMSGGFGTGDIVSVLTAIVDLLVLYPRKKFTLIILCGKNPSLFTSIESMVFPENIYVQRHGFISNVDEYMDAADIIVSKSGGLTSSEALAKRLPMIIVNPIPGQETRNADILVEHGVAWKAHNPSTVGFKLKQILDEPHRLHTARKASKTLAKPHASKYILLDVLRRISSKGEFENGGNN